MPGIRYSGSTGCAQGVTDALAVPSIGYVCSTGRAQGVTDALAVVRAIPVMSHSIRRCDDVLEWSHGGLRTFESGAAARRR